MLIGVKKLFLFIVTISLVVVGFSTVYAEDYVVATVGNTIITVFELEREAHKILPLNTKFHSALSPEKAKEVRKKALNNLIEQAYKVQYAQAHNISISEVELEQRLANIYKKYKTDEALQAALGKETVAAFRSSVFRILLAQKAEEIAVNDKAAYSEDELQNFFKKNSFMYQYPKQYRVSHILIKIDPSLVGEDRDELVAKAEDLAVRAKAGEDFYNLAYYNSDEETKFVGGDKGFFYSGQTVKAFEDAIKDLSPGEIVGPVETLSGLHIIKLTDVKDARAMTYDEVKEKIQNIIEAQKRKTLYEKWMTSLKPQYEQIVLIPGLK